MCGTDSRKLPDLSATRFRIHGKVSSTNPLRNASWWHWAYDGSGKRKILGPTLTQSREISTKEMLGMQEVSAKRVYSTSDWSIAGRQNHTWHRI